MPPDDPAPDEPPDDESVQEGARRRQRERAEAVEDVVARGQWSFEELDYPVSSEALATEYSDQPIDLPNETESLGSVFDRLVDEEYDTPEEVREAVYGALTGRPGAGGPAEYNEERDLEQLEEASDEESNVDWQ